MKTTTKVRLREGLGNLADRLSQAGWSLGCVSVVDSQGQTLWIVDSHCDGKRFVVRADEKLSAFVELERQVLTVTFYLESINDGNGNQTAPLGLESF